MTRITHRQNNTSNANPNKAIVTACSIGQQELRREADEERYEFLLAGAKWVSQAVRRLVETGCRKLVKTRPSHAAQN